MDADEHAGLDAVDARFVDPGRDLHAFRVRQADNDLPFAHEFAFGDEWFTRARRRRIGIDDLTGGRGIDDAILELALEDLLAVEVELVAVLAGAHTRLGGFHIGLQFVEVLSLV